MPFYIRALENYFNFKGRDTREQYWKFFLWNMAVAFALGIIFGIIELANGSETQELSDAASWVYSLIMLIPGISAGVRRMHDAGHSGWWMIAPIVNIVFLCTRTQDGGNEYGPHPITGVTASEEAKAV